MANPDRKTGAAKALRRRMTPAEMHLWKYLRSNRLLGFKFQRQKPIGPYIVDFMCSTARLIVEIDGDAHYLRRMQDFQRQSFLESEGFIVLRFPNFEVLHNTGYVLQKIQEHCHGHLG